MKRSTRYKKLHARVSDLLWTHWDPIGVNDTPQARDEYDSYVPTVCRLLMDGPDAHKLASHLAQLRTDAMGLTPNPRHDEETSQRLLELASED